MIWLFVQWEQKFPFRLNFSVDDGGSKNTGRYQGALTFSYDNWLTLNDLFYFSINHELGDGQGGNSRGHALHYSIPIRGNWLLSLNGSTYKYEQIIPGINQDYTYSGDSTNYDVTLSRRFIRTSTLSSNVYVKGWSRYSNNFIDGSEIQVQKRRTAGWEVGADLRQYIGRSILNAGASYKRGTGANGALRAAEEEYGGGTSRMKILSVNATLNSPFQIGNQRFRYFGTFRGQWNNTRLVAQDQFSIGGRYTVRGFDGISNLMGERGILVRNDLGWVVPKLEQEVYLGVDYGQTSGPSSREQVGNALMGTVIGIRGGFPATKYGYLSYDLFGGTWLKKPTGFKTSKYTGGFNLNLSF